MSFLHSNPELSPLRRFSAELLAYAVLDLFPKVLLVGGEETDTGFIYDFVFHQPIHAHILELIEVKMRTLAKEAKEVRILSMMRENAHDFFTHHHQPILAERALEETDNILSLIQIDVFYGLIPELPIPSTAELKYFKLLMLKLAKRSVAGEEIEVTRIEGTAFVEAFSLKKFLKAHDKLKKSDHRLLGPELGLFNLANGLDSIEPYWYPKGQLLYETLSSIWKKQCQEQEVQLVSTPLVVEHSFIRKEPLLLPSFEWRHKEYALSHSKINHHLYLFESLKDKIGQPLRLGELTTVYEAQADICQWGLFRTCSYRTDLVTIFCPLIQVVQELIYSLQFIQQAVKIFGFEAYWYLVSATGARSSQSEAIKLLSQALQEKGISYSAEEQKRVAHPRLEVRLADSLGRAWQAGRIEVIVPQNLSMPVVLVRSVFGSLDRWIALLIEQYKGEFPIWLAPEQIRVLTVGEASQTYAESIYRACRRQGFRAQIDNRHERLLGAKVHEAEKERVPYIFIIGNKEELNERVTVRAFQERNRTHLLTLDECLARIKQEYINQASKVGLNY